MSVQKQKENIHPHHLMERMKAARKAASSQVISVAEFLAQCPEEVKVHALPKKKKKLVS